MKEAILRATAKIISKKGMSAASTRSICQSAGISAPTLYHYFSDKTAVLDAVVSMAFEKHYLHTKPAQRSEDPLKNLISAWDNYIDFALCESELYLTMIEATARGQILTAGHQCFQQLLLDFAEASKRDLLKHGVKESAHIFLAGAQGIAIVMLAQNPQTAMSKISTLTRDLILEGLIKKSGK